MQLENLSFIKNSELRNLEILFIYLFFLSYYFNKYTTIYLTWKFPFSVNKRFFSFSLVIENVHVEYLRSAHFEFGLFILVILSIKKVLGKFS